MEPDSGQYDLRIMSALVVRKPFDSVVLPDFAETGQRAEMIWAPTTVIQQRLAAGERPDIVLQELLERKLSSVINQDLTSAGGLKSLVDLLNQVDRGTERAIFEALEGEHPDLAEEVRRMMFLFVDIVTLDDRSIQQVLREVDTKELAVALKGTREDVKDTIFRNMS